MGSYTIVKDPAALEAAKKLARGCYQTALLDGREALSGATLRGRAASYMGRYRDSGRNLLRRLSAAGIAWHEARGAHGKRILVIGEGA